MTRAEKKAAKMLDEKVTRLASRAVAGIVIPIMEIPAICKVGQKAAAEGADDAGITAAMAAYIKTIRVRKAG